MWKQKKTTAGAVLEWEQGAPGTGPHVGHLQFLKSLFEDEGH